MKEALFSALLLLIGTSAAMSQENLKLLNVQETTEGIGVYPCGDRHEAMVQFVTSEPFGLTFESTHDRPEQMQITVDSIAGKKTYSIVFVTQEPGKDFSNRKLIVRAPGFQEFRLAMPLKDKQMFEYTVSDPYSVLRSPFFTYLEKAQDSFKKGEYMNAKDNYELCRYCPEYLNDTANILNHMAICDSMLMWSEDAVQAEHLFDYDRAIESYRKLLRYDQRNEIRQGLFVAQQNFTKDCAALLSMGQKQLDAGNIERAEQMFNQIIDNGCVNYTMQASEELETLRKARLRRDDHSRTFMLAIRPNPNLYGISWGNYYRSKANGWYGTIMTNGEIFKMLARKSYVKGTHYNDGQPFTPEREYKSFDKGDEKYSYPADCEMDFEFYFSTGPSWHIWAPIYIHFGVGYHLGGFNYYSNEEVDDDVKGIPEESLSDSDKNKFTKNKLFHAVAPEGGIVLKYGRAVVKATYQYSFWLNEGDYSDYLKENTNWFQFGVGFCW